MTPFDLTLIEQAQRTPRFDYRRIYTLIDQAQTHEARRRLNFILIDLKALALETL